jgi:Uma2 family endonuclease
MDTPRQYGDDSDMVEVKGMSTAQSAPRLITVDEFDHLVDTGFFGPDERVDLIGGVLVSHAPPHNPPHAGTTACLTRVLGERLGRRFVLWVQLPVVLSERTELEPDIALLVDRGHFYQERLPRVPDVHAVVEVAYSSLSYDRGKKLRLYAESGIAEYWIVDVAKQRIHRYTDPVDRRYAGYRLAHRGDAIAFEAFPDVVFSVDELFG